MSILQRFHVSKSRNLVTKKGKVCEKASSLREAKIEPRMIGGRKG